MSDINENLTDIDENLNVDSRLNFSKLNLIFITETNKLSNDFLTIENISNSSIFFNLRKTEKKHYFNYGTTNQNEYFFYHEDIKIIYPGEKKTLIFSFLSNNAGSYTEQYEIIILPENDSNNNIKKTIKLSGFALKKDDLFNKRIEFSDNYNKIYIKNFVLELIEDIFLDVKTTLPPPPDLTNEIIRKQEFEEKNQNIYLNYTILADKLFLNLEKELNAYLNIEDNNWKLDMNYFTQKINSIENLDDKENFWRKFNEYKTISEYENFDNHYLFNYFKNSLYNFIDLIPEINDEVRTKMEVPLIKYKDPFYEFIPQETDTKIKEQPKKKFKNEEEEKKYHELIYEQIYNSLKENLLENIFLEKNKKNYYKFLNTKRREITLDFIDQIKRKKNTKNFELFSKRVLLKISIRIHSSPQTNFDDISIDNENIFQKIDQYDLKMFLNNIKEIISYQPKIILIFIDFINVENIEFDYNVLIKVLYDYLIKILEVQIFIENTIIEDWEDNLENNYYEDGSLIFLKDFQNISGELGYYYNDMGLKYNLYYENKKQFIDLMNNYCNIYVNSDINNFYNYNKTSQSILNCSNSIVGYGIVRVFDFISSLFLHKDLYDIQKDEYYKEFTNIKKICIIGGDFNIKKLSFIINTSKLFNEIYLYGKISLIYILFKYKIYNLECYEIDEYLIKILELFEDQLKSNNIKICLPTSIQYFEKNEENLALYEKIKNLKNEELDKNENTNTKDQKNVKNSENNEEDVIENQEEIQVNNKNLLKNFYKILKTKDIDFKSINENKEEKSEDNQDNNSQKSINKLYFNNEEFYFDFNCNNNINELISDENNKIFIYDNISIHSSLFNSKLNKDIISKIYFKNKLEDLEELEFQNNKNNNLYIWGNEFINLINSYHFVEDLPENKKNSNSEIEDKNESQEEEYEEKSNSNTQDFDIKNNIEFITSNNLIEENFFLNLFIKNKLKSFNNCEEDEKKILDPDDLDFSFIRFI